MGAIVSIPMMQASSLFSCCGAAAGYAFCSALGGTFKSSIMTRLTYATLLLLTSLLSWISLSSFIVHRLEKVTFGYINNKCGPNGEECISFTSVHRICLALGVIHLTLAVLLVNVKSKGNSRDVIQNGCWRTKVFSWVLLILINFMVIPDNFFIFYGNHIAIIFSTLFILIGLLLLVDFSHSWAETCLEKIEMEDLMTEGYNAGFWKALLIGGTLSMYVASIILVATMHLFFNGPGCSLNKAGTIVNDILLILVTALSISPRIQEANPRAGLAQSAMVVFYCSYLVMSAVASEPDDKKCNPLIRSKGARTASIVLGALLTFLAIAYTTTRAAATSVLFNVDSSAEDDPSSSEILARRQERYDSIKQAVNEGLLPESALALSDLFEEYDKDYDSDSKVKYNYTLFHVVFFLATQYVATLLTTNLRKEDIGDFVPVGRTYFATWVKIISSWVCYGLYGWTLVAPVVLENYDFSGNIQL